MAHKPNPDRKVVNGKAVVSAKELADFQSEYGSDKTLRDLLNADKGLSRAPEFGVNKPRNLSVKDDSKIVRREGATYPKEEPAPKTAKARSLVDQGRGVQLYKDVDKEAVLEAGLGLASMHPAGRALSAARPVAGAIAKKLFKEDSPAASIAKDEDPAMFRSGARQPESAFERMVPREFKKGGKIDLGSCRVSTTAKNKSSPAW